MGLAPILAQAAASEANPWSWAIVLLCVILGLIVTLNTSRRTSEIKRTKDD